MDAVSLDVTVISLLHGELIRRLGDHELVATRRQPRQRDCKRKRGNSDSGEDSDDDGNINLPRPWGTEAQAEKLETVVRRALQERTNQTVLLSGYRGSGKTATVEHVLRRLQRRQQRQSSLSARARRRRQNIAQDDRPKDANDKDTSTIKGDSNGSSAARGVHSERPFRVVRLHGLMHQKQNGSGDSASMAIRYMAMQLSAANDYTNGSDRPPSSSTTSLATGVAVHGSVGAHGGGAFTSNLDFIVTALKCLAAHGEFVGYFDNDENDDDDDDNRRGAIEGETHSGNDSSEPCSLVVVLDHFDCFAADDRQMLLYSLLDLRHAKGIHVVVVAISSHMNVLTDLLEKRVRSRFGDVEMIHFVHPTADVAIPLLRNAFELPLLPKSEDRAHERQPRGNGCGASQSLSRRDQTLDEHRRRLPSGIASGVPVIDRRLVEVRVYWNERWNEIACGREWEHLIRRQVSLGRSLAWLRRVAVCSIDALVGIFLKKSFGAPVTGTTGAASFSDLMKQYSIKDWETAVERMAPHARASVYLLSEQSNSGTASLSTPELLLVMSFFRISRRLATAAASTSSSLRDTIDESSTRGDDGGNGHHNGFTFETLYTE